MQVALNSNTVTTATVEVKTKKQLFDRSHFRTELTLVSQSSLAYRKSLEQADSLMNQWFDENEAILMLVAERSELHPHSDINILILLNESGKRHQRAIEQFLTLLWDCNLKVGSSVRTIAEGAADLTIITTMIESRL